MSKKTQLQPTPTNGQGMQKSRSRPPVFPWPTSHPGPDIAPPLPGYQLVPMRPEQMMLVTGEQEIRLIVEEQKRGSVRTV